MALNDAEIEAAAGQFNTPLGSAQGAGEDRRREKGPHHMTAIRNSRLEFWYEERTGDLR